MSVCLSLSFYLCVRAFCVCVCVDARRGGQAAAAARDDFKKMSDCPPTVCSEGRWAIERGARRAGVCVGGGGGVGGGGVCTPFERASVYDIVCMIGGLGALLGRI